MRLWFRRLIRPADAENDRLKAALYSARQGFLLMDDRLYERPGIDDEALDSIDDYAGDQLAALCEIAGHEVEDDQCGMPSHRFCVWCRASMPGIPVGNYLPVPEESK